VDVERRRLRVRGTVQGVGFRPYVHRTAVSLDLAGSVGNDGSGVVVDVEGPPARLDALERAVRHGPPLASVEDVAVEPLPLCGTVGFEIVTSTAGGATDVRVSADVAPCDACLAEMADPSDRRFRYPFVNCTDCGPRYTIVRDVPYDRARTTMASFAMCAGCRQEYDEPADRRFHAQPVACPECGPRLAWSPTTDPDPLAAAVSCLLSGGIVAVKGIGGYHLACDAAAESVVAELRRRKRRSDKPFAVMVADLDQARRLCLLDGAAADALVGPRRPVVLAPRQPGAPVAVPVAPRSSELGVMLPSSPLHVLLLQAVGRPLVMTSGNWSDEPVVHRDEQARALLGGLADGVLSHDREVHVRTDDSVVRSAPGGRLQLVRRARGWAPQPLRLPVAAPRPVLAVGAHLKSTVALARGGSVVLSQHLGDLGDWATYTAFTETLAHLTRLSGTVPEVVAHDLHPDYRSTAWARESGLPLLGVQHHHAHIAACLAEHGETSRVLGIAYDGIGLGTDGTLWGGELLLADLGGFERVGHLAPVPLPGGDAAVREPWRMALAWLHRALGADVAAEHGPRLDDRWRTVLSLAASGRAPETTSAGRLFDAVAALLDVRRAVTYEGQAAVELESLARRVHLARTPRYELVVQDGVLDPAPLLAGLLEDRARGVAVEVLAAAFHVALARGTAEVAARLATGAVDTVALSGGVFSNVLLSDLVAERLRREGLRVLQHEHTPPNDGSISLGQAAVAAAVLARPQTRDGTA
jgi:hydrogenase maturation protein HypF